ncbi:o-succinylbenzoate synthase [Nakamurella sp. YIM 132084]|uniref:o-succinylbenzoate synthase n=2 Tax=Nakamurella leprariae TaxID=2803911 RepID=A0A938YE92_9ACTN|nr:o-succinylbenzoate synthase [Nakamurella leprariae]
MRARFRGITVREGVLLRGPVGWGEFAPFWDYDDAACVPWLRSAVETATRPWPAPVRTTVPVNVTVPVVGPERAAALVRASGCRTAKVKVADPGTDLAADADRLAAVREAIGADGAIRIDANAAWDQDEAVDAIRRLDRAAGGLEYVEQPCRSVAELAAVRRRVAVPIAADESIRRAEDPLAVARAGAADLAVVKVAPLGGVWAALRIAEQVAEHGLPIVVSSAVDTAVGLAAGLALAAALPELPYACGLATAALLVADVSDALPAPVDGALPVLPAPPSPDRLDTVAADEETTARWTARLARVARLVGLPEDGHLARA